MLRLINNWTVRRNPVANRMEGKSVRVCSWQCHCVFAPVLVCHLYVCTCPVVRAFPYPHFQIFSMWMLDAVANCVQFSWRSSGELAETVADQILYCHLAVSNRHCTYAAILIKIYLKERTSNKTLSIKRAPLPRLHTHACLVLYVAKHGATQKTRNIQIVFCWSIRWGFSLRIEELSCCRINTCQRNFSQPGNLKLVLINGLQLLYKAPVNYLLTINKAISCNLQTLHKDRIIGKWYFSSFRYQSVFSACTII